MSALTVLVIIALVAAVGVLFTGIGSMGVGGAFDRTHSLQLMESRIALQGFALLLIVVALLAAGS
ncbi:MAG: HIG1 domain-containing protein [Gammaproteobacteria bacterium]